MDWAKIKRKIIAKREKESLPILNLSETPFVNSTKSVPPSYSLKRKRRKMIKASRKRNRK